MAENSVDWRFIQALEGFTTQGYVPYSTDSGQSGVTIGAGFDIGQHSKAELYKFNFSIPLLTKLLPYVGAKGATAKILLNKTPLVLMDAEAQELDACVRKVYEQAVEDEYNDNSDIDFCSLDSAKQTVIMSVGFQYGSIKDKCPHFFDAITKGDWALAVSELENFGDVYSTRRHKEAALLQSSL